MKCERCGNEMINVYQIEYKMSHTVHDYFLCERLDCQHCIKIVSYSQEVTGKEKEHVLEARAGMEL